MLMCLFLKHSKYNLPSFCFPFLPFESERFEKSVSRMIIPLRFFLLLCVSAFIFTRFFGRHCSLVGIWLIWMFSYIFVCFIRTVRSLKISIHLNGHTSSPNNNTNYLQRSNAYWVLIMDFFYRFISVGALFCRAFYVLDGILSNRTPYQSKWFCWWFLFFLCTFRGRA